MTRIYDNPNHPHYGPVRRTWVILVGLDVLDFDAVYHQIYRHDWDARIAQWMDEGLTEGQVKRLIVRRFLLIAQISPQKAP